MWRGLVVAALGALLACGDGEEAAAPLACVSENCVTLSASCGTVDDGCGNTLQCGECLPGQTCGAAGPSGCGVGACTPATCQAKGATCGSVADGCGGTLSCGDCPPGQACGGAGTPYACAAPACTPTTCAGQRATCGTISDGCGGELACGTCKEGDACGAGGRPNVCAPIPATGDVRWSHAVGTPGTDVAVGAGQDAAGNRYLLTFTPNEVGATSTLRLQKLGAGGELVATKEWAVGGFPHWADQPFHLSVTPAGSVYLAVSAACREQQGCERSVDLGGAVATDSVLVKLTGDGRLEWQRELTGSNVAAIATNEQGSVAVGRELRDGRWRIEKYQHDGTLLRTIDGYAPALALDPSGNVLAVTWGSARKYAPDGSLVWQKPLSGGGFPIAAATTAKGTLVVLASRAGDVEFGASTIRSGSLVLYVVESDARARFARGLPWTGQTSLAVDPTGRAAVVGSGQCGEIVVEAFDLANADLWRRFLPDAARCWAGMVPGPASYGADHRLFLTGSFSQTVEIGGGTWLPRGQDAIGILLDP